MNATPPTDPRPPQRTGREDLLELLEFTERDRERIAELSRDLRPHLGALVEQWHTFLTRNPHTRERLPRNREHLRAVQTRHFQTLLSGPYDEAYFASRTHVGEVHDRAGVEPFLYLGSYRKFLEVVRGRVLHGASEPARRAEQIEALEKIIYLDVILALDAFSRSRDRQLRQAWSSLAQAAESLEEQNRLLSAQIERTEEGARLKTEFLSRISHELRTPIHGILGYADLMADGIEGEVTPGQARGLSKIRALGERLVTMVDEMIEAAKLASAGLAPPQPFDPTPILRRVGATARDLAAARGLGFALEIPPDLPPVCGAPDGFSLALEHLVENAAKFTEHGQIRITATPAEDRVRFCVMDSGPGVAPEEAERIFEPFHQADGGNTRPHGGLGLGLSLARQALRRMGGALELTATGPGGSTFAIILPGANRTGCAPPEDGTPPPRGD